MSCAAAMLFALGSAMAQADVLPVTNGLACWFDAGAGVGVDTNGAVQRWEDVSGNGHFALRSAGAPALALNQVNARPVIQLRTTPGPSGFNLDGPLFVKDVYVVGRSPGEKWSSDGCFFGRRWARASSHRLSQRTSAFWGDQWPEAVSRNGKKLSHPFDLAPITEFMIVRIRVNDGDISPNTYQIGMGDGACCDMDIAEIIGYADALSPEQDALVGKFLAAKYGIVAAYPAVTNPPPVTMPVRAPVPALPVAADSRPPVLLATNGLVCWFDASTGVTANGQGGIESWKDRSGNGHDGTPRDGAPVLVPNQLGSLPAVRFRGPWLTLEGAFFAQEHFVVIRSPGPRWSGPGGILGRLKGRGSSYNTWGNDTGFWQDQFPAAVSKNGAALPGPAFDCSPLTNFMVLRIVVNDHSTNQDAYAIGNNDGLHSCDFDIAEILGYDRILSPPEEETAGGYLAAKYGIKTLYPPLPPASERPLPPSETAAVKYKGWQHSGSLFLLTTPEGANLPASARVENFPVLVRLDGDWFNFGEAEPAGADIRFATAEGAPLAYQIEEWNPTAGRAAIWVRVPTILGNSRQELRLYWGLPAPPASLGGQAGKPGAVSESSGPAVFNKLNRYLSVWHMGDPLTDETGSLVAGDAVAASVAGPVGLARHFAGEKGIDCGDRITTFPFASSPHTSEAWLRADRLNSTILNWDGRDGVELKLSCTPGRILVESGGRKIEAGSVIPKSEWVHVAYTYDGRSGLVYVNGALDVPALALATLKVLSPVRMQIGPRFLGDLDEVRVSSVARSADWLKLQYENQKTRQTLVGPLVRPGDAFSVSQRSIALDEGRSVTVTARAGGAQKLYWIVKKDGAETVLAADRYSCTVDAGRVLADSSYVLQLKAVCAGEVKTRDVPVTVKNTIPEPVFTLKAPAKWNGRDPIEVVPEISNLAAMQAKGAGELHYHWTVEGGAVLQSFADEPSVEKTPRQGGATTEESAAVATALSRRVLVLKRSLYSGPLTVKVAIHNGGASRTAAAVIQVREPQSDAWEQRTPGRHEKPEEGQFYARDDRNEGTLYYNGTLTNAADSVFLRVYADDKLFRTETGKPAADGAYAFTVKIKPGLIRYRVEFGTKTAGVETVLQTVGNLVCGDAYLIDGQSNALALDTGEQSPNETNEWIRTYGGPSGRGDSTDWVRDRFGNGNRVNLWSCPAWRPFAGSSGYLGWWGMDLAKRLLASQKMPICIIQAAVGGTRIDEHRRCETNRLDLGTMYGKMLWRVENARLTHGIRAVLWHQGEADQGSDGPDGGYGWETYPQYFVNMSLAWKQDFPNVRHFYIFQIWPNGCSQGSGHGDMLREKQRTLPRLYSNMDVMSTVGIRPGGGCHYPLAGWSEFARLLQPLIERDFYGRAPQSSITAPNLKRACYTSDERKTIVLEFDQPVVWSDALAGQFYLDGIADQVASGAVSGSVLTLKLKDPSAASTISYLHEMNWREDALLRGANGIAALTFCEVPLMSAELNP